MKGTSFVFFGLVCFIAFLRPFSVISQTPVPSVSPEPQRAEADLIHFGDVIDVDFAGGFEYDWRGQLTPDGVLGGLDEYSGPIPALCRSETDVASDIERIYSKILRDPKVTVKIIDRSNRAVARLDGAVKMPMRFRIQRPVRLRELIVAAGGFTDDASGDISIFRPRNLSCVQPSIVSVEGGSNPGSPPGNGLQTINITISELLTGKESADPLILSGDLVTVGKALPIYVIGAVNNPKPIYSRSGMTLSRAIATAGGLATGAAGPSVTVFRRDGTDSTVVQADLEKIKNGEIHDVDLKAFDIIEVAFKGRAQRKYPPVIATGDRRGQNTQELPLRIID